MIIRVFLYDDLVCVRAYLVVFHFNDSTIVQLLALNTLTGIGNN